MADESEGQVSESRSDMSEEEKEFVECDTTRWGWDDYHVEDVVHFARMFRKERDEARAEIAAMRSPAAPRVDAITKLLEDSEKAWAQLTMRERVEKYGYMSPGVWIAATGAQLRFMAEWLASRLSEGVAREAAPSKPTEEMTGAEDAARRMFHRSEPEGDRE